MYNKQFAHGFFGAENKSKDSIPIFNIFGSFHNLIANITIQGIYAAVMI